MPTFTPQVREGHYVKSSYLTKDRWINYWYQWQWLQARGLKTLLEVGVGNGVVAELFEKTGIEVTTIDIDEALKPTKVASVTALPFSEDAFDGVLCAEVLEHLPFEESLQGIRAEIYRVTTRRWALITLTHAGYVFLLRKIPNFPCGVPGTEDPVFGRTCLPREHYWELGKRMESKAHGLTLQSVSFTVHRVHMHADDQHCFLCEKHGASPKPL